MEPTSELGLAVWLMLAMKSFVCGLGFAAAVAEGSGLGRAKVLVAVAHIIWIAMLAMAVPRFANPTDLLVQVVGIWVASYAVFLWLFKRLPSTSADADNTLNPESASELAALPETSMLHGSATAEAEPPRTHV